MTEENRNENDAVDESQETEESPTAESTEQAAGSAGFVFGDDAARSYPGPVNAALEFAAANKYEYGPRLRDAELNWDVISAEPMANDIVRVHLEFLPTSGFRGDPGSEYMDIDVGGAILARRQLSTPRENKPIVLVGVTVFSVILAVVLISLMTVFKSEGGDPLYVAGRILWIRAEEPKQQPLITYTGADVNGTLHNWEMKPEDEANNELVYVKVTLINQTSGTVNMVIDEDSVKLLDGNRKTFKPIDTIANVKPSESESNPKSNVPGFVPMWGSLKLNEGEQVAGMMVFELPSGSSFSELRWTATDSASIKYQ